MTKLYRSKDRLVREVDDGPGSEVRLRCLKRAGFVVGELPPERKPKPPVEEKPLPPTEGEEVDGAEEGEPVLAKHAPIGVPLQEVKGAEAETDAEDESPAEDAADDESAELPEGDGELPEATVTVDGEEVEGVVEETTEDEAEDPAEEGVAEDATEDEPEGKDEDGEGDGTDELSEEGSEDE